MFRTPLKTLLMASFAFIGGYSFHWLGTPLPWMLGSMAFTAVLSLNQFQAPLPRVGLRVGLMSIGLVLGLYFTPTVIKSLWDIMGWVVVAALLTCLLSFAGAVLLCRITTEDKITCFYAAGIGAASDMATQAAAAGARGDLVAIAHSIRLVLVVSTVPLLATYIAHHSGTPVAELLRLREEVPHFMIPWYGFLGLMGGSILLVKIGERCHLPNPWVLSPLLSALIVAVLFPNTELHPWVAQGGQVLLGWNLGQRFTRQFFRHSPKWLVATALMTVIYGVVSGLIAVLVHWGTGLQWASSFIATAPGGISEMAITAKALGLNPPTVTAFHAVRMVAVVICTPLFLSIFKKYLNKKTATA